MMLGRRKTDKGRKGKNKGNSDKGKEGELMNVAGVKEGMVGPFLAIN